MSLSKNNTAKNPFIQFEKWYNEQLKSGGTEPTAVVLATSGSNNIPSARVVLLKEYNSSGFVFYTNYDSKKGVEIAANPVASLLFYWAELQRQIRIQGKVEKLSLQESESYFKSRPRESQLSAWASNQSREISSRSILDNEFESYKKKFEEEDIPLPGYWGGYRVIPFYFEFWQGRENRLHDRLCYRKENDGWKIFRLAP